MITIKTLTKKEMDNKRKNTTNLKNKLIKKRRLVNEKEDSCLQNDDYETIDYYSEYKQKFKETLIPLYEEYISKYSSVFYIEKEFLTNCEEFCKKLNDNMKVLHVNKCAKFLRLMFLFQFETEEYKSMVVRFRINCYPMEYLGNIKDKLIKLNNMWENQKKWFEYDIDYKVERLTSLFHCFSDHNDKLRTKLSQLDTRRSIVETLTNNFLVRELEDIEPIMIDDSWENISVQELKQFEKLEIITLENWEDIEDCINNCYK